MENCSIYATDTDECASNPCQNGGRCTDAVNGYTCTCLSGYEGDQCERKSNTLIEYCSIRIFALQIRMSARVTHVKMAEGAQTLSMGTRAPVPEDMKGTSVNVSRIFRGYTYIAGLFLTLLET